jgi:peptidoglycan-N-acetylglucosamine deacetylase
VRSRASSPARIPFRRALESGDPILLRSLAARGFGAAVLPRSLPEVEGPAVEVRRLDPPARLTVAMVWRRDRRPSPAARTFHRVRARRAGLPSDPSCVGREQSRYVGQISGLALTFDDGPDAHWTAAVLDALAATGARGTFFVLGERVRRAPELIARMRREGHAVAVHGDAHLRHTAIDAPAGEADLTRALETLAGVGVRPTLWRTPWGVEAPWTRPLAERHELSLVGWSADTHDWRGDRAADMLAAVEPDLGPGVVVLAHDAIGPGARREDCAETVALIAPLVAAGRARGLEPEVLV